MRVHQLVIVDLKGLIIMWMCFGNTKIVQQYRLFSFGDTQTPMDFILTGCLNKWKFYNEQTYKWHKTAKIASMAIIMMCIYTVNMLLRCIQLCTLHHTILCVCTFRRQDIASTICSYIYNFQSAWKHNV